MTAKSVEARRNGPPFTAVSNAFIDWLMADCTGSEVQVFLYLSRRIEGTEKGRRNGCDSISVSQICHGIRKVDKTVLDRGTGLGVEAAVAALAKLEAKGIVIRKRGAGPKADTYSLTPEKAAAELKAGGGKHSEKPSGKHSENRNGGTRKIRTLTTREIENTKQRRKESHHQEESLKESSPPQSADRFTETSVSVASEPEVFSMKKGIDDDERPKLRPFPERREGLVRAENPPSSEEVFNSAQAEALQLVEGVVRGEDPVYASARDELVATVKKRTGQSLTFRVLDRITNSLESKGVTMPDFVAAVRMHNLEAVRSVPAFLTDFARGFQSANKTVIPEVVKPEDMPRICELGICGGHGHENLTKGVEITFCKCSIGQELRIKWQRAEERHATAVASRPCQSEAVPASGREIRNRLGAASAR